MKTIQQPYRVTYFFENKNGVHIYPPEEDLPFHYPSLIRIKRVDDYEENKEVGLYDILNRISIKGKEIQWDNLDVIVLPHDTNIVDISNSEIIKIKNIKDLVFELKNNSKIKVTLFPSSFKDDDK